MSEERKLQVELELVDGFEFLVRFGDGWEDLVMDEPEPLGGAAGPGASRVLSAAIGNCLSASLLFCLQKSKLRPAGLRTAVSTSVTRNEQGRLRIGGASVEIHVSMGEGGDPKRLEKCLSTFEDFCIVTQSVRRGIDVEVSVFDQDGRTLHHAESGGGES